MLIHPLVCTRSCSSQHHALVSDQELTGNINSTCWTSSATFNLKVQWICDIRHKGSNQPKWNYHIIISLFLNQLAYLYSHSLPFPPLSKLPLLWLFDPVSWFSYAWAPFSLHVNTLSPLPLVLLWHNVASTLGALHLYTSSTSKQPTGNLFDWIFNYIFSKKKSIPWGICQYLYIVEPEDG